MNALLLGILVTKPAKADVISTYTGTSLNLTPTTVSYDTGHDSLAFTLALTGFGPGAAVATGGTSAVTTVFGGIADFEDGATIDGSGLYSFMSYPAPATIPFSVVEDFIGFSFVEADGTHYGYAEVSGPELVGYAIQSTAGQSIVTNEIVPTVAATPEPGSLLLFGTGLTCVFRLLKRRSNAVGL